MGRNNQQRRAAKVKQRAARRASAPSGAFGGAPWGIDLVPAGEQPRTVDDRVTDEVLHAVDALR